MDIGSYGLGLTSEVDCCKCVLAGANYGLVLFWELGDLVVSGVPLSLVQKRFELRWWCMLVCVWNLGIIVLWAVVRAQSSSRLKLWVCFVASLLL